MREKNEFVGQAGKQTDLMGDQNNGRAFIAHAGEQLGNGGRGIRINVGKWLVQQQQLGE